MRRIVGRLHLFVVTADEQTRAILRANLVGFSAIWDAMFFLLLVAFLLGTFSFGLAAVKGRGLQRAVGVLFLLAVPLTFAILLSRYGGMTALDTVVSWSYPILQPLSRALLGLWLWQRSLPHFGVPDPIA